MIKKYRTPACVEWDCKRCGQDVVLDEYGSPKCGCDWRNSTITYPLSDDTLELAYAASPWEHKRCLNGDGSSEFVLFGRRY